MRIAGAVFAFARPDYLDSTLSSLEGCVERNDVDWHIYQDVLGGHPEEKYGYQKVDYEGVEATTERINQTTLPITEFVKNRENRGINYQINRAFKLFHYYDLIYFFEDDLVVSKYYLRLLRICAQEHPNIVGTFYSNYGHEPSTDKELRALLKVQPPRYWGFYMTREAYDNIKVGWRQRYTEKHRSPYYDVILTQLVRKHTDGKYNPLISRAYNVGIEGVLSTNPDEWKKRGIHKQSKEITYTSDRKRRNFILMSRKNAFALTK